MKSNPGKVPKECIEIGEDGHPTGRVFRVRVKLFGGYDTAAKEPAGWPATGRGACNWTLSRPPYLPSRAYEIEFYELI